MEVDLKLLDYRTSPFSAHKRKGNVTQNPLMQFSLFAVALILFVPLTKLGIIPSSTLIAIGNVLLYTMMAVGFCLLLGYSGLASLGVAGFVGIGAYAAYYCMQMTGLPYIVTFLVTLVVSIVLGVAVGFISLRIDGIYLAIVTLGLSEILRNLFVTIEENIRISINNVKFFGLRFGLDAPRAVYIVIVILTVLLMVLTRNLIDSPTGRAMLAMKNSTAAAQAMGVSLMKYRLLAFTISTVYAALAGMMYFLYVRNIYSSTSLLLTLSTSLNILGAVIIGGSKSIWGTTVGVFIIYGLKEIFLSDIKFFTDNPSITLMFSGLLIVVIVCVYPGGLAQLAQEIRSSVKKLYRKIKEAIYGKNV